MYVLSLGTKGLSIITLNDCVYVTRSVDSYYTQATADTCGRIPQQKLVDTEYDYYIITEQQQNLSNMPIRKSCMHGSCEQQLEYWC